MSVVRQEMCYCRSTGDRWFGGLSVWPAVLSPGRRDGGDVYTTSYSFLMALARQQANRIPTN